MTRFVQPCRHCKRGRIKLHNSKEVGSQISADKCIYCEGRGFLVVDDQADKDDKIETEKQEQNSTLLH